MADKHVCEYCNARIDSKFYFLHEKTKKCTIERLHKSIINDGFKHVRKSKIEERISSINMKEMNSRLRKYFGFDLPSRWYVLPATHKHHKMALVIRDTLLEKGNDISLLTIVGLLNHNYSFEKVVEELTLKV